MVYNLEVMNVKEDETYNMRAYVMRNRLDSDLRLLQLYFVYLGKRLFVV